MSEPYVNRLEDQYGEECSVIQRPYNFFELNEDR